MKNRGYQDGCNNPLNRPTNSNTTMSQVISDSGEGGGTVAKRAECEMGIWANNNFCRFCEVI